ncbi:MAG: tRNA lysidine(34) synthetase TilS [Elusimicrobiota bacterium]
MDSGCEELFTDKINYSLPHILCVSGGSDSIYMLHTVARKKTNFKSPPEIVHFNHGLREQGYQDEEFVQKQGKKFSLPVKIFRLDVKKYSRENKCSIEEAARILRYESLEKYTSFKKEKGFVFTAHTLSDQAETIIFRLISGTGSGGLRGIRRTRLLNSGWTLSRPMLGISSHSVKNYLKRKNISYRQDESNYDLSIPRNFIRHRVVPLFKKINPSFEKNIQQSVDILSLEADFMDKQAEKIIASLKPRKEKNKIIVELKKIISYNKALLRLIIRKISPVDMGFSLTRRATGLLFSPGCRKSIDIGRNWKLRKDYEYLFFEKKPPEKVNFCFKIKKEGELFIDEIGVKIIPRIIEGKINISPEKNQEVFDLKNIDPEKIIVRSRRPGDKIKLMGGGGRKKIKDILIDDKISLNKRRRICVFEHEGNIIWLAPLRRSSHALKEKDTKKALSLKVVYKQDED